jgi:Flp pilus assembly protein CpaB
MTYRLRNILIALALALLAALLTTFYVTNYKHHVQHQQTTVGVVVAAKDIPVGMTGEKILATHALTTRKIARQAVVPGAISSPQQIARLVATQPLYAGEQVTERRFGTVVVSGLRGQINGTYRIMQLAGDPNQLLLGTLRAGDHVDFLGNVKVADEQSSKHFARIVLRDLLVLKTSGAAPTGASKITAGPNGDQGWVMLRVTDAQSQKLFFVYTNEDWSLELRPTLNAADSPNSMEDALTVVGDGIRNAQRAILKGFVITAALRNAGQDQGQGK